MTCLCIAIYSTSLVVVSSMSFLTLSTGCHCKCTEWLDDDHPKLKPGEDTEIKKEDYGDYELLDNIKRKRPYLFCPVDWDISCRAEQYPDHPIETLGQKVECSASKGLICNNRDQVWQLPPMCYNYQVKLCCSGTHPSCCLTTTPPTTPTSTTTAMPTTTTTIVTPTPSTTHTPTSTVSTSTATQGMRKVDAVCAYFLVIIETSLAKTSVILETSRDTVE